MSCLTRRGLTPAPPLEEIAKLTVHYGTQHVGDVGGSICCTPFPTRLNVIQKAPKVAW